MTEIQPHEGAYNVTQATRMNPSDAFEHDKKAINNFTAELYSQLLNVQIKKLSQPKHDFTGKKGQIGTQDQFEIFRNQIRNQSWTNNGLHIDSNPKQNCVTCEQTSSTDYRVQKSWSQ